MRKRTRTMSAAAAGLGLVVTSLLLNAPPASAEPECLTSSSDFDRDGAPDVVVGVPGGSGRNGAVHVRLTNLGKPFTTTVTGSPGFGTAITSLSSYTDEGDDELCSQLVVGSPDESLRTDRRRSGVVYLYTWSPAAKRFVPRATIEAQGRAGEDAAQSGARFGAALAAEQRPADQIDPRPARLFVGAPGMDISIGRDTGQVTSFWVDADEDPDVHDVKITRLGEPLTDEPTPGAALGSSLSIGGGKVAMGMPGFPTQDKAGAGAVLVDDVDGGPDRPLPLVLSQASAGVPGTAEAGDRFGTSVHLVPARGGGAPTLLVGTPGEDVGSKKDAGSVTVARISLTGRKTEGTVRTLDQNSAGMAGSVEAGDQLGASVSSVQYGSSVAHLVGAPGEDVGRVRDAGMVQTIGNGKGWTQGTSR
ncbi:MAG TPA: hypothetical protein VIT65_20320, partial [Microlunatus sp.]